MEITPPDLNRFRGCLLGLATGDAVGTTVEFCCRGTFTPVTDMIGGGPFDLAPGQWTDDTSMALCLVHSLLTRRGFDAIDQMNRYCNWMNYGYLSSTGNCFDVGMTVAAALREYQASGNPWQGSPDPHKAGNGALMRLAPIPMFYFNDVERVKHYATESTRTTHGAEECIEASRLFAGMLRGALAGCDKAEILFKTSPTGLAPFHTEAVKALAAGDWVDKPIESIRGSGYVIESLEAALWCFYHTDTFEAAILRAVNLGDDADTTAAICGQLAGAFYGESGIPGHWREKLYMAPEIGELAEQLAIGQYEHG
ncbi:ADP-ribosylglycohydrolase family protein [Chitinivorax sp. B]|uniref:ADP-ribosylglycohydrolase family protein n=1 Tax=Chitinivorax sp. B TaxID=2502235 RepID=UPI0010F69892|nr:ADP-ribosylglycohydrolase family protein [Chitinivorax sp. B]